MSGIFLQQVLTGFLVKSIASFDDTLTRIPVLAELTRGKAGKIAFSIGTLLALTVILIIVIFFSTVLNMIPHRQYLVAGLIFLLALAVYFEVFSPKKEEKIERKLLHVQAISNGRFFKLIGIGFIVSFVTNLDDMVVLMPLFIGDHTAKLFRVAGIYLATLTQIVLVVYFSRQLSRIKYKKELATLALVILAALVWRGVI